MDDVLRAALMAAEARAEAAERLAASLQAQLLDAMARLALTEPSR